MLLEPTVRLIVIFALLTSLAFIGVIWFWISNRDHRQRSEPLIKKIERLSPRTNPLQIPLGAARWNDPRSFQSDRSSIFSRAYSLSVSEARKRIYFDQSWTTCILRVSNAKEDIDGRGAARSANRLDVFLDSSSTSPVVSKVNYFEDWSRLEIVSPFLEVDSLSLFALYEYGHSTPFLCGNADYSAIYSQESSWLRVVAPLVAETQDSGQYDSIYAKSLMKSCKTPRTSASISIVIADRNGILNTTGLYSDKIQNIAPYTIHTDCWLENIRTDHESSQPNIKCVNGDTEPVSPIIKFRIEKQKTSVDDQPWQITGIIENDQFKLVESSNGVFQQLE